MSGPLIIEFWSSIESHGCQRALMNALREKGCVVVERYLISGDSYRAARSVVSRIRLRLRAYIIYPVMVGFDFMRWRSDTVYVVSSNTFYAPWIAILASNGRAPIVHWVLDLYPNVLVVAGIVKAGGWLDRALTWLMRETCSRVSANIFLGSELKNHAERVLGADPNSYVIPIGADDEVLQTFSVRLQAPERDRLPLRVLYCGNMGYMHDVETLATFFDETSALDVIFEFRGHGRGFGELRTRIQGAVCKDQVLFGPNLDDDDWCAKMRESHIALVTMRNEAAGVVMPSKAYSAMLAGQAILAICPVSSDLAVMIQKNDVGWVIEPGDVTGLMKLLRIWSQNPETIDLKRRNAHSLGWSEFRSAVLAGNWMCLFEKIREQRELVKVV
jgi:glycosyltransferase involved in cell wall biosynthesis